MKKLIGIVMTALLLLANPAFSQESVVAGGFEASGHTFIGAGWQTFKTPGGANALPNDVRGSLPGTIGAYADTNNRAAGNNKEDVFMFFVDEIELDITKTFGENVRFKTDLDFGAGSLNSGRRFSTGGNGVLVEQAYVTTNVPVGNGVEVLVGRFNVPLGFEKGDVTSNDTVSRSIIYRALRPNSFTGAKFYYPINDMLTWQIYAANPGLVHDGAAVFQTTDIPTVGSRFGFHWGEEGQKSHVGLNGVWGQDHANVKNAWSYIADVDFQWWTSDNFALGGEGIYRQINTTIPGEKNGKYYGGLVNMHYDFSDVWDGTFRYAYAHDVNGSTPSGALVTPVHSATTQSLTGADQQLHEMVLAGNYAIAEGAKFRLEGGYTYIKPSGATGNQHAFGAAAGFAYDF